MNQDVCYEWASFAFSGRQGREGSIKIDCLKNPSGLHRKMKYSRPNATIKRNIPTIATGSV